MNFHQLFSTTAIGLTLSLTPVWAGAPDISGVEPMNALVGEWVGTGPEGEPVRVSYHLTSGGAALMETLLLMDHPPMVTTYYVDGDGLMMTHYCSLKNQPRMRASMPAEHATRLVFSFVDATNLTNLAQPHMHGVAFTFQDPDHMTQEWTLSKDGKQMPHVFTLAKKK